MTLLLTSFAGVAQKQGILNKLLSPGPLMLGHEKLEHVDCLKCHEAGKGVPDSKCLDCHKNIKKSIKKKKSFHGKVKKSCFECHPDHKGRDYDSTIVDEDNFDHKKTGYDLTGKHADLKCSKCHTRKRTKKRTRKNDIRWFGNATTCFECHKKDSKHYYTGKWKKMDCGKCHTEKRWDDIHDFDHTKDTEFELRGAHQKLKCNDCHVVGKGKRKRGKYKWKNLKTKKCLSCHDDQHKGKFSNKMKKKDCTECHSETKWKIRVFNHNVTGYKLEGKHAKLKCSKCHNQNDVNKGKKLKDWHWKGLKKNCVSCHKDYHGFDKKVSKRYKDLKNCKLCHDQLSWKEDIDFDHNLDTKWKITGKHKQVACFQCHVQKGNQLSLEYKKGRITPFNKKKAKINVPRNYHWAKLKTETCTNCHKNPHLKTFKPKLLKKKCTECHVTQNWHTIRKNKGGFDHNVDTDFKITGQHKKLKCNDCHVRNGREYFKFENAEKQYCVSCHTNVHVGQFSKKFSDKACSECHTTKTFKKIKKFNHKKTRFKLTGRHKNIQNKCSKCHVRSNFVLKTKPPKRGNKFQFGFANEGFCESCHKNEHKNQFHKKFYSLPCTDCHITKTFKKTKKFDHNRARFELKGKHKKLKCTKCHVKTRQRYSRRPFRRKRKFIFQNIMKAECSICHKDKHNGSFGTRCSECHNEESWKSTVDFHKNFTLSGVHYALDCNECHTDRRSLEGQGERCQTCHQKDDIHHGSLPNCGECHRQQFWEVTAFKHSLTNFPLRGSHRSLDCASCHSTGIYQGTSDECISCHLQDAQNAVSPPHTGGGFTECSDCHNQFIFSL